MVCKNPCATYIIPQWGGIVNRRRDLPIRGELMFHAMSYAIETINLGRNFHRPRNRRSLESEKLLVALDAVNLTIPEGELFGLLGPNGAGKTTLIKILCTLLLPTSGTARVQGIDVNGDVDAIRRRINMVGGGEFSGYGILSARENLWVFSQFYGLSGREARRRIDELIELVGLAKYADIRLHKLSTGLRQKLNLARGFINDPDILFLDEPTLGLDVQASREMRSYVRSWVKERPGKTVLLTTHYMREADEMCDRLAIIDHGRILACDDPQSLKQMLQRETVLELELAASDQQWDSLRELPGVLSMARSIIDQGQTMLLTLIMEPGAALAPVLEQVAGGGGQIDAVRRNMPTLEDVFIALVGRGLEQGDEPVSPLGERTGKDEMK